MLVLQFGFSIAKSGSGPSYQCHPAKFNFFKETEHGTTCRCSIFPGMSNDLLALQVGIPLLFKASQYFLLSDQLVGMVSGSH